MPRYIDVDFLAKFPHWQKIVKELECAPTADVREVRHGHWVDAESGDLQCSVCGHFTSEIIGDLIEVDDEAANLTGSKAGAIMHVSHDPYYCSRCGAQMFDHFDPVGEPGEPGVKEGDQNE